MNKKFNLVSLIFIGYCFCLSITANAQVEKFDVMTFTSPKGWTGEKTTDSYRFSKSDKKKKLFCAMVLTHSYKSQGSSKADFQYMWNESVKKGWGVDIPEKIDLDDSGKLASVQGGAEINYQGLDSLAVLVTISSPKHFVSVLIITNDTDYLDEALAFISGIDFNFPKTSETGFPPNVLKI